MALLTDKMIRDLCLRPWPTGAQPMLDPFSESVQKDGVISFGLTHAGYDLRLGTSVYTFKNSFNETISPKRMKKDGKYIARIFDEQVGLVEGQSVLIPPNGYILGVTLERICMPQHLKGRCVGKSSLARCGVLVNTTPIEPGWRGYLTLEIANVTPCPVEVYVGEGIAQLEFETLEGPVGSDYEAKAGKYQDQPSAPIPGKEFLR